MIETAESRALYAKTGQILDATFMVNLMTPFIITYRLLNEISPQPKRIINVSCEAMSDLH